MGNLIAYYRVSTKKQGESGLGLDAQRETVARYINGGALVAEYTEVESGKRHKNRPKLQTALAECKKLRATLLIAKLDRLSRNVAFISNLMDSGVEFIAADMPFANRLTLHVMAAMAEHEAAMISQRTKDGLAAARRKGKQLGNPRLAEARELSRLAPRASRPPAAVLALIDERKQQEKSLRAIANELNALAIPTPRNRRWHAQTVKDQAGK